MTHSPDTPATPEGDAVSRALPNAYYECAGCTQQGSESNCRPAEEIRLAPDETWLCEYCYDDAAYECGEDANWPVWADLPKLIAALPSPQNGEGELAGCKIALEQAWASCREHIARTEKAEAALAREEKAHEVTIGQRDRAEDMADKLAQAIGGDGIGEHSSGNCPWSNALEIAALTAQPVAQEPVAWHARWTHNGLPQVETFQTEKMAREYWGHKPSFEAVPLYAHPATPAPVEAGLDDVTLGLLCCLRDACAHLSMESDCLKSGIEIFETDGMTSMLSDAPEDAHTVARINELEGVIGAAVVAIRAAEQRARAQIAHPISTDHDGGEVNK